MENNSNNNSLYVTTPFLPSLEEVIPELQTIWKSGHITNNGPVCKALELELAHYLGVKYLSLVSNGTTALMIALKALNLQGEVITTPFTYISTAHALHWNGLRPVFADIDPDTFNIDPEGIESLISPDTTAILAVHVFGNPCAHEKLLSIAEKYGLKLIYDCAHGFGVNWKNFPLCSFGDLSILSFHATKIFNTVEGGAIISHDETTKKYIDALTNSGFDENKQLSGFGLNGHLNEFQAAIGRIALKYTDGTIEHRKRLTTLYRERLRKIIGIQVQESVKNVKHNYVYFPVLFDEEVFGHNVEEVCQFLENEKVFPKRYFYPLVNEYEIYQPFRRADLTVAKNVSNSVLCLPLSHIMNEADVIRITDLLEKLQQRSSSNSIRIAKTSVSLP